ncbi:phospho-N-acetylmuramoyl-pentapeptide-transferase [Oscillospiraceae bacterium OttesenSCG-928-F05]|nr:phospho-N-acetylmuramoyl-pentapeptide-transferase [Oscillospiraceae bacterium OttesenSCG-928-F05]
MSNLWPFIAVFGVAFLATLLMGVVFIPFMRKKKLGQQIREVGPSWHMSKQGTPTMGGLMFSVGALVAVVGYMIFHRGSEVNRLLFLLLFSLGFGVIGFIDDFVKVAKKQNLGLTVIQKLLLQLALAVLFLSLLRYNGFLTPNLFIPFIGVTIPIPWVWYLLFAVFAVVGTVNAVNFTDGVDGLLTVTTIPVMIFFAIIGYLAGAGGVTVFALAVAGGLCAFLIYNFNPAKIFMGDTGSLFLGGAVAGLAFAADMPLIILVVGALYVVEMVTVVIQIVYFKATGGKRFFKMTPIHHHFEMSGWSEKKLCAVFGTVTLILCALALVGVAGKYGL